MFIRKVGLENFRNFKSLDLPTDQGFVVLVGLNGAGKTNFLEAISFGAALKRFPESQLAQLFRLEEPYFRIRLTYQNHEPSAQEVFYQKKESSYQYQLKVNEQVVGRARYVAQLPVVSFLPQELNLLTRTPGERRRFLNEGLSGSSAEYRFTLGQYKKTLIQRNELWQKMKIGQSQEPDLTVWDEQLAEFGSHITQKRREFINYINANFESVIKPLSPMLVKAHFIYHSSGFWEKQGFLQKLQGARPKERELGTTVVGPHRDDFAARLEGQTIVGYVSRGQLRSITLALKILEKQYLEEKLKQPPIMLLDDVFSELDDSHQDKLIEFLKSFKQVFLTTAHLHEIKDALPKEARVYTVREDKISV